MKFITFCTQWSSKSEEERHQVLGEHADKPFSEFLKSMGVGETLQSFIINTLGILQPRPTAMSVGFSKTEEKRERSEIQLCALLTSGTLQTTVLVAVQNPMNALRCSQALNYKLHSFKQRLTRAAD